MEEGDLRVEIKEVTRRAVLVMAEADTDQILSL